MKHKTLLQLINFVCIGLMTFSAFGMAMYYHDKFMILFYCFWIVSTISYGFINNLIGMESNKK